MTTARFYVSETGMLSGRLALEGGEHHHASHVLRMRAGESVILMDGNGLVGRGTIEGMTADSTSIIVTGTNRVDEELPRLHLYQALPHGTKMDGIVRRGVELGAASLRPFMASRSRPTAASPAGRDERWRRIALEASRVAGRHYLPQVAGVCTWDDVLGSLQGVEALFADEAGGERPAAALADRSPGDIALVVGPEGGFTEGERESLKAAGARPVTLGGLVLRTETAGMVLLAAVRCHYGLL